MSAIDWASLIPAIFKMIAFMIDKYKRTPSEKRREALAAFDAAYDKAKQDDLRDLSKWLGGKL